MSVTALGWLFVAAVAIHNLEEAIGLPRWSRGGGRWRRPIGQGAFGFAAAALALFAVALATLATLRGPGSWPHALLAAYALAMCLNAIVPHLAASLLTRSLMPGLVSAWLVVVPVAASFLSLTWRSGAQTPERLVWSAVVMIPGLAAAVPVLLRIGARLVRERP